MTKQIKNKRILIPIITTVIFCFCSIYSTAQQTEIRVNLGGYAVDMPKNALLLSKVSFDKPILLLIDEKGKIANEYPCRLSNNAWSPFSYYYSVDFSEFKIKGKYYFELKDSGIESKTFQIGPYPDWQEDVVAFIRTQRCGFNPHTKQFCHQLDGLSFFGIRPDSTRIDATGGWHDAADQLKYLITGSNTTARILMAYQMNPGSFKDEVDARGLPGANNLPDILDEAKWGLEWILKLHPAPNELYHQVADDRDHRGFKLPHEDNADYGWGTNSFGQCISQRANRRVYRNTKARQQELQTLPDGRQPRSHWGTRFSAR